RDFHVTGVQTCALPISIETSGYNIQVNTGNVNRLFAQVNMSSDKQNGEDIYLVVHHLGRTYYVSKQAASKAELTFSVPKEELPSGVLTISVLNHDLVPLMERPVFIFQTARELPLAVALGAPSTGTRKHVTVSLESGNPSDSVRNAVLSASVINASKIRDSIQLMPN